MCADRCTAAVCHPQIFLVPSLRDSCLAAFKPSTDVLGYRDYVASRLVLKGPAELKRPTSAKSRQMWGTLASRYLLRKKLGEPLGLPLVFNSITASERYASADLDLAHDGVGREAGDLAIARAAVNAVRRLAQVDMVE